MRYFLALSLLILTPAIETRAQSTLLQSVKRNPEEALALCEKFRALNKKGISARSEEALKEVSRKKNLSKIDAEILSLYVIGLNCPDVN